MRTWIPALAVVALAVGCDSKVNQASTGKEFLEKFQKAEKDKDSEKIWNMLAKESREDRVSSAKKDLEKAKASPEEAEKLKKDLGMKEDPMAAGAEKIAQAKLTKQLEKPTELLTAKFVEEKTQGNEVILVVEVDGKGKREIPLVREGESLHVRWDEKSGL